MKTTAAQTGRKKKRGIIKSPAPSPVPVIEFRSVGDSPTHVKVFITVGDVTVIVDGNLVL